MLSIDCVDDAEVDEEVEAWSSPTGTGKVVGLEACALDRPDRRRAGKPFTAGVVDSVQTTASSICIGRHMILLLLLSTSGDTVV
jgi:hypothetical protein